jgi:hypothetical protein
MLAQLVKPRQFLLNWWSLDNARLPSQAQALASLLTLLSSGFSQLAHLVELWLQCQFGCQVWCHPHGQHQYYHLIKLGLQCRFSWRVWCHPLGQHQYRHWWDPTTSRGKGATLQCCPPTPGVSTLRAQLQTSYLQAV